MASIPNDVIVNIFSRLPVKDVLRFRSVCKAWCKLLSTSGFVEMHLNYAIEKRCFNLLMKKSNHMYPLDDLLKSALSSSWSPCFLRLFPAIDYPFGPFKSSKTKIQTLGSCNGLTCMIFNEKFICIWNLSTKDHKKIPTLALPIELSSNKSSVRYGFGYGSTTRDYKLLKIMGFSESDDDSTYRCDGYKVDIYSLRSNSWRSISNTPYYVKNIVSYARGLAGLLVTGALHWIVYLQMGHVIASFHIDDETFTELPKPKHFVEDEFRTIKVGLLGGCLCLLVGKCFSEGGGGDIWVMKNYGAVESWTLSFTICAQQVPVFQHFSDFRPVKCFKHAILFQQNDNVLVLYDLNRKRARTIKVQGSRGRFSTEIYVGSLVSPSSFTVMG